MQRYILSIDNDQTGDSAALICTCIDNDLDEVVNSKMILRSQFIEVPLQGLFHSILNFRKIQKEYFSNKNVFKLDDFGFVHLDHIKGTEKQST